MLNSEQKNMTSTNGDDLLSIEDKLTMPKPKATAKARHKKIKEIMEEFNFTKVHETMVFLKWTWRGASPSIQDIKDKAKELLTELATCPLSEDQVIANNIQNYDGDATWYMARLTGGLEARRFGGQDAQGQWENFSLSFNVASYCTEEV